MAKRGESCVSGKADHRRHSQSINLRFGHMYPEPAILVLGGDRVGVDTAGQFYGPTKLAVIDLHQMNAERIAGVWKWTATLAADGEHAVLYLDVDLSFAHARQVHAKQVMLVCFVEVGGRRP